MFRTKNLIGLNIEYGVLERQDLLAKCCANSVHLRFESCT